MELFDLSRDKIIKILSKEIKVIVKDNFNQADDRMGSNTCKYNEIIISKQMPYDAKAETLLHEILEHIVHANDMEIKHEYISFISNCLYCILKENGVIK